MCCVISGGNWNNAGNAGVWTLNLNNVRGNSNNNVGFRSDSLPYMPNAACACWQRGSLRRALRRNVLRKPPLVAVAHHVVCLAKIGVFVLVAIPWVTFAVVSPPFIFEAVQRRVLAWIRSRMAAK